MPLRVQENRIFLVFNGKLLLLGYADDVNMLGEYLQIIWETAEIFIKACKGIGLEINSEKTISIIIIIIIIIIILLTIIIIRRNS